MWSHSLFLCLVQWHPLPGLWEESVGWHQMNRQVKWWVGLSALALSPAFSVSLLERPHLPAFSLPQGASSPALSSPAWQRKGGRRWKEAEIAYGWKGMKCCFSSSLSAFPLMMSVMSITRKKWIHTLTSPLLLKRDDTGMRFYKKRQAKLDCHGPEKPKQQASQQEARETVRLPLGSSQAGTWAGQAEEAAGRRSIQEPKQGAKGKSQSCSYPEKQLGSNVTHTQNSLLYLQNPVQRLPVGFEHSVKWSPSFHKHVHWHRHVALKPVNLMISGELQTFEMSL